MTDIDFWNKLKELIELIIARLKEDEEPPPPDDDDDDGDDDPEGDKESYELYEPDEEGNLIYDRLVKNDNLGYQSGGRYSSEGWSALAPSNHIIYKPVNHISHGTVTFTVQGLDKFPPSTKYILLAMWDEMGSNYTENPYRVHIRVRNHRRRKLGIRWMQDYLRLDDEGREYEGERIDTWANWDEWTGMDEVSLFWDSDTVSLRVNGNQVLAFNKDLPYSPADHVIELGQQERDETPVGPIFSNLLIQDFSVD